MKFFSVNLADIDAVKILVENGGNVNAESVHKWTPLHLASRNKGNFFPYFFSEYESISIKNSQTFLGKRSVIKLLLEHGANVNATSADKRTPLHLAADSGDEETIKILLENGADVNAEDNWKWTPLSAAAYNGSS